MSSRYLQYFAIILLATGPVAADADEPPKTAPEKQEDPKADETKGKEGSLLDKLSKELFKDLDEGPAKKPEKDNKLERVANGMRDAGDKLNEDQTGKDTRKVQEQVIRDLDELIKQMQNPPPPPQGQGGGGSGGGNSGASGKGSQSQMQKLGSGRGQAQQGQGKSQSKAGQGKQGAEASKSGQEKKVAEGSEERTESERKAADEAARKKKLEMDVWGHLPPHLRDQLLNTYGEKVLPKYQHLVKQFYEALSEQCDTGPRR